MLFNFTDSSNEVPFDLVFLIRLKYVKIGQSLIDIIRKQHGGLKGCTDEYIESIIEGNTGHRVLLMIDGYDQYKPGTNRDIDETIENGVGRCFLILTSRPGDYLKKFIRDKLHGEIIIEGLSEESIKELSTKYLGSEQLSDEMLRQAKAVGIYGLLHISIILNMVVVVFLENKSLPKSRTALYYTVFRLTMDRATLKTFGHTKLEDLLYILGEFSWEALQNDIQQVLLQKVRNNLPKKIYVSLRLRVQN